VKALSSSPSTEKKKKGIIEVLALWIGGARKID
jgi:hypothetical protein